MKKRAKIIYRTKIKKVFIRRKSHNTKNMARRRSGKTRIVYRSRGRSRRSSPRGIRGIASTIKPFAAGIGMARIGEQIAGRVAPQYTMWGAYGGAYLGGGLKGLGAEILYRSVTGQGGILSMVGAGQSVQTEAF